MSLARLPVADPLLDDLILPDGFVEVWSSRDEFLGTSILVIDGPFDEGVPEGGFVMATIYRTEKNRGEWQWSYEGVAMGPRLPIVLKF